MKKKLSIGLVDFHQPVFHNFVTAKPEEDEFDDLSDDVEAKAYAHRSVDSYKLQFNLTDLESNAISFPFLNKSGVPSRFSDASFPVWYGSIDLKTTFYETIPGWKKKYFDAPHFLNSPKNPKGICRVFTVHCDAALIDLRNLKLIGIDDSSYAETRRIGLIIYQGGYPGLLTQSARVEKGENVAIFKQEVLSSPQHNGDYLYEYHQEKKEISVKQLHSNKIFLVLADEK